MCCRARWKWWREEPEPLHFLTPPAVKYPYGRTPLGLGDRVCLGTGLPRLGAAIQPAIAVVRSEQDLHPGPALRPVAAAHRWPEEAGETSHFSAVATAPSALGTWPLWAYGSFVGFGTASGRASRHARQQHQQGRQGRHQPS